MPAESSGSADSEMNEVARFAANARRPEYASLCERLAALCGTGRSWAPLPDHGLPAAKVVAFTLGGCRRQKTLDELQNDARDAGCHLILAGPWAPPEEADLVLFPTSHKLAVVAAVGTEGANYGVQNANVIAWLETLEGENPFHLVLCNHELVGGVFVGPVKGARKLAERMVQFCPSCLDEVFEDAEGLALALKKRKSFLLRWD
jgi:hypothetical protein